MNFNSILFPRGRIIPEEIESFSNCLSDLNLDQVFSNITSRKKDYRLEKYFNFFLDDITSIVYRQEVFQDMENKKLREVINLFAKNMVLTRRYLKLIEKLNYDFHIQGWHLEAVLAYTQAVSDLADALAQQELHSQGLCSFRAALIQFVASDTFTDLMETAFQVKSKLQSINFNVIINGRWVRVRKHSGEKDCGLEIKKVFKKFRYGEVKEYRQNLVLDSGMNHVEAQILNCVIKLYPDIFQQLEEFYYNHTDFINQTIHKFDREIQFYIAYSEYIDRIKRCGLMFSYPKISDVDKAVSVIESFDIALADKHCIKNLELVSNDFFLKDKERIIIVSGPNQGGKTTFARMIGQLHYLGCLGCPVPGSKTELFLVDGIYTHFEQEEDIRNLRGKLKDDLLRLKHILDRTTGKSLIILNEILTSTSHEDAILITTKIVEEIINKDALCVCVSFIDELSTMSEKTVSMVSMIEPENPALRTYKIIRKPADGRAFAIHIAKKHNLTKELIRERMSS